MAVDEKSNTLSGSSKQLRKWRLEPAKRAYAARRAGDLLLCVRGGRRATAQNTQNTKLRTHDRTHGGEKLHTTAKELTTTSTTTSQDRSEVVAPFVETQFATPRFHPQKPSKSESQKHEFREILNLKILIINPKHQQNQWFSHIGSSSEVIR